MSLESRQGEQAYLKIVENLVALMADRIMKAFMFQSFDESIFPMQFLELYKKLVKIEANRMTFPKFSQGIQSLTTFLLSKYPQDTESESSNSRSETFSPGFEQVHTAKGYFWGNKGQLEDIEEEDHTKLQDVRFHSQPRKARDPSPTKSTFKYSLARNFGKDDVLGRYNKMTEKFLDRKKGTKEDSLLFSNGIFFHVP
jgi:hypothetical protein